MKNPDRESYFGTEGKRLYFQDWGDLNKPVILLFHGFPGCADHGKLMTTTPHLENFRLISFDRPGYGRSDFQKKLTPMNLALQVKELLNHLEIDKLTILSVSGGAPYSLAMAYVLKERVQKLTSVAGVAPLTLKNCRYLNSNQRKAWMMSNLIPNRVLQYGMRRVWKSGLDKIDQLLFSDFDSFSEPDQNVFKHPDVGPVLIELTKKSLTQGPEGILADLKIYSKAWGFPISEVLCPITLWHGSEDDVVHYRYAQDMSRRLPQATLRFIEGEGHYSLPMNCRDEIIRDLLDF